MAASYPGGLPTLPPLQVDGTDTVNADDVNLVYTELTAVAQTVGLNPATRSAAWNVYSYNTSDTSFGTVGARIKNVEDGVQTISAKAITTDGGRTIVPSGATTVNLSLKAAASQTANLLEFKTSDNTVVTAVGPAGNILVIDGGSA